MSAVLTAAVGAGMSCTKPQWLDDVDDVSSKPSKNGKVGHQNFHFGVLLR